MVKTLYMQVSARPLPRLQEGDRVLLMGDRLISPPAGVPLLVLADDLRLTGLSAPPGARVIDHDDWVALLHEVDRCVSW